MNNKNDIINALEQLMAMDNSDKEYLVNILIKDPDIKSTMKNVLANAIAVKLDSDSDSNKMVKSIIEQTVSKEFSAEIAKHKKEFDDFLSQTIDNQKTLMVEDIRNQAEYFSKTVEQELKNVLASEVAIQLYDMLSNKTSK